MHHGDEATSTTKGIVEPDSQDKLKMARFSGGTYSKPDGRVKLIPAEEITYSQHRKPYGRTVGSAGSQKKHCRRSVTPPPSSRRVSLLGSRSLAQNPMPSVSSYDSCLPHKRLQTAENRDPCAGGHISSSVTHCISSLKNLASPCSKSSQPLSTNLNTDAIPRNLDRMVSTQALARSSSSSILHSQGQNSEKVSPSLPKEVVANPMSPSPKQIGAPHPSDNPLVTKAGTSKSVCTPESGKLCSRDINLTTTSTTVPVLQAPIVEPALLSPTSVLSERKVEVYPDTRTAAPIIQERSVKPVLLTPIPVHRESSTECQKVPPKHNAQSIPSAQHGAASQERNSGSSISHGRSSGPSLILHMKLHNKHYQSEACWKGNFHVTEGLIHTCDGIEAHFPLEISVGVYKASNQMPEILNLEAVPLSQLWPKKFKMVPPDSEDIGLWFMSSHQRPHRSFDQLLEKVCSHGLGLFTKIGDTELAVFSSKLLTPQDQRKNGKLYFWGVFGKRIRKKTCQKRIRKKTCQPNSHIKNAEIGNPSQPNDSCNKYEEVGMKLDVTKGKEKERAEADIGMTLGANGGNPTDVTGNRETVRDNYEGVAKVLDLTGGEDSDRVNDCMAVLGTLDSNPASSCSVPAASFLDRCRHHDSAKNSTSILEDSACQPADRSLVSPDLMLDIPPEFSPVPPGFTKAHSQLQIGTAALSCANVPSSLILDIPPGFPTDIPPGFTEAHRGLPPAISPAGPACVSTPGTQKKPFIRFSLNVPRPVKMGVPFGFTPLHAVKKEPGLTAVEETTHKPTLYSLAAAASAVVKPGKGDEMKIVDSEVKIEDENSEEREFPKIRRLSDLYRGPSPSDSSEISRPMPARLPNKFLEQTPVKQMHQRKSLCQASRGPSPAETAIKKSNVNGRIALNKGAGHGNGEARCVCASIGGRAAMPTKGGPFAASAGGHLDNESISCRCIVCGEEFPAQ
ncbi:hypothetical protein SORBI_3001G457400 [Sorghum bicolor]|uniref:AIPP2-like SPOC-like domain-containing protein n=1 Tax=Sorghum bicolor TaxID=4558 RepID=A0A1Z5SAX0_SORBI|nr:hypothetical protein SORBI_3001G457400 [Sorghum bicolor]OQU93009.1 hypothetical protein SORBI_3001G457400 [Sorghum bicolor]